MTQLGVWGVALLHFVCSAAWLFLRGIVVAEGFSSLGGAGGPAGSATQGQTHVGIIVTVVVVVLLGFLSASYIAKRYCFPQSHQVFMYSTLRRYEELNIPDRNTMFRQHPGSSESDQTEVSHLLEKTPQHVRMGKQLLYGKKRKRKRRALLQNESH